MFRSRKMYFEEDEHGFDAESGNADDADGVDFDGGVDVDDDADNLYGPMLMTAMVMFVMTKQKMLMMIFLWELE